MSWKSTVTAVNFQNLAKSGRLIGAASITLVVTAIASAELSRTLLHPFISDESTPLVVLKPAVEAAMPAPTVEAPSTPHAEVASSREIASWSGPVYVRRANAMPLVLPRVTEGVSTHAAPIAVTAAAGAAEPNHAAPIEPFTLVHEPAASRQLEGAMFADASWLAAQARVGGWPDEAQQTWSFVTSDTGRDEISDADVARPSTQKPAVHSPDAEQVETASAAGTPRAMRGAHASGAPAELELAVEAGTPLWYEMQVDTGAGDRLIPPQAGILGDGLFADTGLVVPEPTALLGLAMLGCLTRRSRRPRC